MTDPSLLAFVRMAPLCVVTRALFEHLFRPEQIDPWFRQNAIAQYDHELTFSALVQLMAAVAFRRQSTVRSAYLAPRDEPWPVTISAVYQKLQNVEPHLCAALLADTAIALNELIEASGQPLQRPLPGYRVVAVDGSHAAATDRRLKVLRGKPEAPLPAQSLVVRDYQTGLLCAMVPEQDAHASEKALIPKLYDQMRADDVWIGDRQFAMSSLMKGLVQRDAFFVVRRHGRGPHLEVLGEYGASVTTEAGSRIDECPASVAIGLEQPLNVRMIRIHLAQPTQDGDEELFVLSNLPEAISAETIAELYRSRWRIEGAFQVVENSMHGEVKSLGYPKAALFAMTLSMVAYNVIVTVKHYMAASLAVEVDAISDHRIGVEVQTITEGMLIALPPERWQPLGGLSVLSLASWLKQVLSKLDAKRYIKTIRGVKKPRVKRNGTSNHVATHLLLKGKKKSKNEP